MKPLTMATRVIADLQPPSDAVLAVLGESPTRDEVMRLMREAIDFHIEGLREAGEPIPPASSEGEVVEVDAA